MDLHNGTRAPRSLAIASNTGRLEVGNPSRRLNVEVRISEEQSWFTLVSQHRTSRRPLERKAKNVPKELRIVRCIDSPELGKTGIATLIHVRRLDAQSRE